MDSRDPTGDGWLEQAGGLIGDGMDIQQPLLPQDPGLFGNIPAVAQAIQQYLGFGQPVHVHAHPHPEDGNEVMEVIEGDAGGEDEGAWEDYDSGAEDEMMVDAVIQSLDDARAVEAAASEQPSTVVHGHENGATSSGISSTIHSPPPEMDDDDANIPWAKFKVLPSAPPDHAFLSKGTRGGQQSRQFMSRLSKEYRLLTTGLPGE